MNLKHYDDYACVNYLPHKIYNKRKNEIFINMYTELIRKTIEEVDLSNIMLLPFIKIDMNTGENNFNDDVKISMKVRLMSIDEIIKFDNLKTTIENHKDNGWVLAYDLIKRNEDK
jgi:hypothetical protein